MTSIDEARASEAVLAAADLVGRAGGVGFDIGFEEGDPIVWHAQAYYRTTRLFVGGQSTPQAAATGLAIRLLTGAACRCGRKVRLRAGIPGCLWRLEGSKWVPNCDAPSIEMDASDRGNVASLRQAMAKRQTRRGWRAS